MNAIAIVVSSWAPTVMAGLWRASWQASALAGAVLLVQLLLGRRLGGRGRYALWSIVLLRLLLPVLPPSPTSVYNLWEHGFNDRAAIRVTSAPSPAAPPIVSISPVAPVTASPLPRATSTTHEPIQLAAFVIAALAAGWLFGALILAIRILAECRRFARVMHRLAPSDDPTLLAIVRECAATLQLRRSVRVLVGDVIRTPAVTGVFRPALLLPTYLLKSCDPAEQRVVVLHELAHVKRWDVAANWVIALAYVLHWFNPVMWFAASRMRADRELACDELVLARISGKSDHEPALDCAYGPTLIRVVQLMAVSVFKPNSLTEPSTVGILEPGASLRRRVHMIAEFDSRRLRAWPAWTGLVLVLLGLLALTDSVHGQNGSTLTLGGRAPAAATQESSSAAPRITDIVADGSQGNDELMQRLQKRLPEVHFTEVPFVEALESLRKAGDLNMTVNERSLESAGIDRNTPVSLQLKNVTIEQALDHLLLTVGGETVRLGFDTVRGAVLVSTEEDLCRHTEVHYYDVQDLLVPSAGRRATTQNYEDVLIKMIQDVVAPDYWKDNGGTVGSIREYQGKLVIEATPRMHRQIDDLLSHLREPPTTQRAR